MKTKLTLSRKPAGWLPGVVEEVSAGCMDRDRLFRARADALDRFQLGVEALLPAPEVCPREGCSTLRQLAASFGVSIKVGERTGEGVWSPFPRQQHPRDAVLDYVARVALVQRDDATAG